MDLRGSESRSRGNSQKAVATVQASNDSAQNRVAQVRLERVDRSHHIMSWVSVKNRKYALEVAMAITRDWLLDL